MRKPINVLFVCGRNNRRSPTAAKIFLHDPRMRVRSGGLADTSRQRVTESDMKWADLVLVMERKHQRRLQEQFSYMEDARPPIGQLDIPDEYIFMQRELVELLQDSVAAALEAYWLEQEEAAARGASD
jgi:predicted protein tyrosine phosphatase